MCAHYDFRQERIRIARYRDLEREVTDPLAQCLIHIIVEELEADLESACRSEPHRLGGTLRAE